MPDRSFLTTLRFFRPKGEKYGCKEAHAEKLGKICMSCQGRGYYTTFEGSINQSSEHLL